MKTTLRILIFLIGAAPLFAQQGQTGYKGLSLISPAEVSMGVDHNFLVDRTPAPQKLLILSLPASVLLAAPDLRPLQLDDTVYLLKAPTMAYVNDGPRRNLSVTYQPEFEIFQHNTDQNSWNSNASFDYSHLLSRRWLFNVNEAYQSSRDPSRTLQNPLLLLPRSLFQENVFQSNLSFSQSPRTDYTLSFTHTLSTFGENDPLQRRLLDTISKSVSLTFSRMLRRNHRLRLSYSVFSLAPWNRQKLKDDRVDNSFVLFKQPAQSVNGQYRFALNPATVLEFSGGAVRTTGATDMVFGVAADRRWGELWVGGGYSRSLSLYAGPKVSLANGLSANAFYDIINGHLRGQPLRRVGLDFSVSASRSAYGTLINGNKTVLGRGRIDYRLSDRTVGFITAETYIQNANDFVTTPLTRSRFFIGFDYSLSSESDRRISRLNRDAQNVALTEHGRLRTKTQ
jgi:hypothetical protein